MTTQGQVIHDKCSVGHLSTLCLHSVCLRLDLPWITSSFKVMRRFAGNESGGVMVVDCNTMWWNT